MTQDTIDISALLRGPARANAERRIGAPLAAVWSALTDVEAWPQWNPAVTAVRRDGPLAPGMVFEWRSGAALRSEIVAVRAPHLLVWRGTAPLGITAVHRWDLTEEETGTLVATEEVFSGWLVRLLPGTFEGMIRKALEQFLTSLAARLERA